MKQPKTKFGTAIRNERLKRYWSQRDVARETGLSPAMVNRCETEKNEPDPASVVRIAECFESEPLKWLQLALPGQFKVWQRAFRPVEKEK